MKKITLALAATSLVVPAVPAMADHHRSRHYQTQQRYYTTDNGIRYWNGADGRRYCKKSNGTVGLIVGGAAGCDPGDGRSAELGAGARAPRQAGLPAALPHDR